MEKNEDTITIPKAEYQRMKEDLQWLGYLEAAGVDNWQGIDYAIELRDKDEQKQN